MLYMIDLVYSVQVTLRRPAPVQEALGGPAPSVGILQEPTLYLCPPGGSHSTLATNPDP